MTTRRVLAKSLGLLATLSLLALPSAFAQVTSNDAFDVPWNSAPTTLDVLANDNPGSPGSRLSIVATTPPSHGTLSIAPGGLAVVYTPTPGYVGPDAFTYTTSDVFQTLNVPRQLLATVGVPGVNVYDGLGSALVRVPGTTDEWYVMSDRGPNVNGVGASDKVFAMPGFTPQIGRYKEVNGALVQVGSPVLLKDAAGNPRTGLPPPIGFGGTGEIGYDMTGAPLGTDINGIDSEGLVALPDGTFWVSDEYGPFVVHFAADGKTIEQLTPFAPSVLGHKLPAVLGRRLFNKGMEGLTITPDGKTLVGLMQDSLVNGTADTSPVLRVVTYDLVTDATHTTGATHQYLYLMDDRKFGCSEIATVADPADPFGFALIADERDGKFPGNPGDPATQKKAYRFSLAGATDVSDPADSLAGQLVSGMTIEALTAAKTAAAARTLLLAGGVTVPTKTLVVDLVAELTSLGVIGTLYQHDKIEGLQVVDGGRRLVFSNDDDFGIVNGAAPFSVIPKALPTVPGNPADFTQLLYVDLANLHATPSTASVTLDVTGPRGTLSDLLGRMKALRDATDDDRCDRHRCGRCNDRDDEGCRRDLQRLDEAIRALSRGLSPDPFADETHLGKKGGSLYEALEKTASALDWAIRNREACLDAATLRGFLDLVLAEARSLAVIAIAGSGASAFEIAKAAADLAKGDVEAAAGDADGAIEFWERAWKRVT